MIAAALALGNESTSHAATAPCERYLPPEVVAHSQDEAISLTVRQVADALRGSKRGSAAGLFRATAELYKLLLGDIAALEL